MESVRGLGSGTATGKRHSHVKRICNIRCHIDKIFKSPPQPDRSSHQVPRPNPQSKTHDERHYNLKEGTSKRRNNRASQKAKDNMSRLMYRQVKAMQELSHRRIISSTIKLHSKINHGNKQNYPEYKGLFAAKRLRIQKETQHRRPRFRIFQSNGGGFAMRDRHKAKFDLFQTRIFLGRFDNYPFNNSSK